MKETVESLNLLIENNILLNAIMYSFIAEFIIYFGIRNNKSDRFFYILIFSAYQILLHNLFLNLAFYKIGMIAIFTAILLLGLLHINFTRNLLFKSRANILINAWDTLGREASKNSPLLIRIKTKNNRIIYGVYAQDSNISFSENINGIFLEKIVNIQKNTLIVDRESFGI